MSVGPRLEDLDQADGEVAESMPDASFRFAPSTAEDAAQVMAAATDARAPVVIWGGGTHQDIGNPVHADVIVSTARMSRIVVHEPDDLTVVAEAGVSVAALEELLAAERQTAALPEVAPGATVGGVIAAGVSGYRRARYGPTRDRMLEVTIVTGDGRTVRGGGRVVKNVSGYDIPRLSAGSFGSLGIIATVALKLWPIPEATVTVPVDDPVEAWRRLYQPVAVIETRDGSWAYLQGTRRGVSAQVAALGGESDPGFAWPPAPPGTRSWSVRVPPASVSDVIGRLDDDWAYVAQHGVGVVDVAADEPDVDRLSELRRWAEHAGGSVVWSSGAIPGGFDPWGTPPASLPLQRRVKAAFDPLGVANPGRLPGGL